MKSQAAGKDDIRQGHWSKDIMMKIKLSKSDWKNIGIKMGWLKTAQAFQGQGGFDKTTGEHFAKAALIAKEKAVKAARSLDGSRGEENMAKAATETYPSFTECSTSEEREECWYELENYCQHLDGTLEDMRVNSGGIPRREGIHALSVLREAMGMKTSSAPSEAAEIGAEGKASDRIESGLTGRIG